MRIAFDSNVVTYFVQANQEGYDPLTDPDVNLAPQKVAAFQLFLYSPLDPVVLPTVMQEVEAIPAVAIRQAHAIWVQYHWHEYLSSWLNQTMLETRAATLAAKHSGKRDCLVLAECEQSSADTLATFDGDFITHLKPETQVFLDTPVVCWDRLAVPRGAEPHVRLQSQHPLAHATWWRR